MAKLSNLEALAAQDAGEPTTIDRPEWPQLEKEARHGLAGRFVALIEPHTEADPVALLIQFLIFFGNIIGRTGHFLVEADRHFLNLFTVLVGESAKGRKGVSLGQARRPYQAIDADWVEQRIESGLSSGEGLIWAVHDPIEKQERVGGKGEVPRYETVVADPGVEDKRLVVCEPEFASTLRVLSRDGNTLSPVIRKAWDTGTLSTLTKNSPARATGAHISMIGHVTRHELVRYLTSTEAGNGFGNRFLWCCVQRSKCLPEGGQAHTVDLAPLIYELQEAVELAKGVGEIPRDDEARATWASVYPELSEGQPGILGSMIARAEAQTMRLACIYALLDRSEIVRKEHLLAALALWDYCEASARYIFGEALGDPVADEILRALKATPQGMTRTQIRDLFGRNKKAREVGRALTLLLDQNLADFTKEPTDGRPAERWFAQELADDSTSCEE